METERRKSYRNMEVKLAKLEQKVEDVCSDVSELKINNSSEHAEIKLLIQSFVDSADKKYCPKWVGDVMKWGLATFGAGVATFLGWLIIRYLETH